MTTKELVANTTKTTQLLSIYANCRGIKYYNIRKLIKKKIYDNEITRIEHSLRSIPNFDKLLRNTEELYIFFDSMYSFIDNSHFSISKLNSNRLSNRIKKLHLKLLFKNFCKKKKSYFMIEKLTLSLDRVTREHFERITGANLEIFFKIKRLNNRKKSSH